MATKKSDKKAEKRGGKSVAASPSAPDYPALGGMRDEMERMMQRFFSNDWMKRMPGFADFSSLPGMAMDTPFSSWMNTPRADLAETDAGYELSVELPGLDEKDLELTLTEHALILKGEKRAEKESKEKDYHFSERHYGSVRRQFPLPADVDREALKASFNNGVLTVTLPKTSEAAEKTRRIKVNAD